MNAGYFSPEQSREQQGVGPKLSDLSISNFDTVGEHGSFLVALFHHQEMPEMST